MENNFSGSTKNEDKPKLSEAEEKLAIEQVDKYLSISNHIKKINKNILSLQKKIESLQVKKSELANQLPKPV